MSVTNHRTRVDILGVHVSATTADDVVSTVDELVETGGRGYICVSDVNALLNASKDPELRRIHNTSTLTLPDGMPLVWSGRMAGVAEMTRVCGPDLVPVLLAASAQRGWRSYFYGGADGTATEMIERLSAQLGQFPVAGTMSPPFRTLTHDEDDAIVRAINDTHPDIIWVGLGAPKQERWMAEHRDRLDAAVLIGVGAAFDMHAGRVRRAPRWMQRSGLEWLFRLQQEPRRLWRRYAVGIPSFLVGIIRQRPHRLNP